MLIEINNKKRNTYKYSKKLYDYGFNLSGRIWKLNTRDVVLIDEITSFCQKHRLHYELIDTKLVRSSNYRNKFEDNYVKTSDNCYRCAYCGKVLKRNDMTVDHIVPIQKAQHKPKYRLLMKMMGITNINDVKNLAPACEKCNKKKGSKLNLSYFINGTTGRTVKGVLIRRLIKALVAFAFIFSAYLIIKNNYPEVYDAIIDIAQSIWTKIISMFK